MPEKRKDVLSKEELKTLEAKLKTRHAELAEEMASLGDHIREEMPKSKQDALAEREDVEIIEAEDEIEEREIHLVEEALQRMIDGTYGVCMECKCDIPLERLEIIPFARYCVNCEEKKENDSR